MKLLMTSLFVVLMPLTPLRAAKRPHSGKYTAHRVQYGLASWYGEKDQGRKMACGERFNEHALIAAHRTLPLGTRVKVTNLRNGRSVEVKIKDRGPAIAGRIIDLSKAAANRLGFTHRGLAPVRVRVVALPRRKHRTAHSTPKTEARLRTHPSQHSAG